MSSSSTSSASMWKLLHENGYVTLERNIVNRIKNVEQNQGTVVVDTKPLLDITQLTLRLCNGLVAQGATDIAEQLIACLQEMKCVVEPKRIHQRLFNPIRNNGTIVLSTLSLLAFLTLLISVLREPKYKDVVPMGEEQAAYQDVSTDVKDDTTHQLLEKLQHAQRALLSVVDVMLDSALSDSQNHPVTLPVQEMAEKLHLIEKEKALDANSIERKDGADARILLQDRLKHLQKLYAVVEAYVNKIEQQQALLTGHINTLRTVLTWCSHAGLTQTETQRK